MPAPCLPWLEGPSFIADSHAGAMDGAQVALAHPRDTRVHTRRDPALERQSAELPGFMVQGRVKSFAGLGWVGV